METSPRYLIRLSQSHASFRIPELEALSANSNVSLIVHSYSDSSPFCIVSFSRIPPPHPIPGPPSPLSPTAWHAIAKALISRSILAKSVHELYAVAAEYESLHRAVQQLPKATWEAYRHVSFKFSLDAYAGKRSTAEQRRIIEGFSYLAFEGRIRMGNADEEFTVGEEWELLTPEEHAIVNRQIHGTDEDGGGSRMESAEVNGTPHGSEAVDCVDTGAVRERLSRRVPKRIFFARHIGLSQRDLAVKHDLKKRPYISTTSMDAELALVTANVARVGAGKLFLDPFTGTGGFMVAAAELGALALGSDIDGRSFRGKSLTRDLERGVGANFTRYKIGDRWGDCIISDLTNSPFRIAGHGGQRERWLDGIICDPPYGVREGLKVLGRRSESTLNGRADHAGPFFVDGVPSHTLPGFVAPKKPYSFDRMLGDILDFAARTLVDGGRLAFWMPVANNADEAFPIPQDPLLALKASCSQNFNKWSRKLLVYERLPGRVGDDRVPQSVPDGGGHADSLNQFRRMYFQGFATATKAGEEGSIDHG